MAINKTFGYIAHEHGVSQYPKVLLALVVAAAVLLHVLYSYIRRDQTNVS